MQRELVVSDEVPSVCGSRECALIQFGPGPAVVAVEALVARADLDDGRTIQKVVCLDVAKLPRKAREALPVAAIAAPRLRYVPGEMSRSTIFIPVPRESGAAGIVT